MRPVRLLPLLCLVAVSAFAHADTITTYGFSSNSVLENKGSPKIDGSVAGTVSVDTTSLTSVANWSANFSAFVSGATYNYTSGPASVTLMNNSGTSYYKATFNPTSVTGGGTAGTQFILDFTFVSGVLTLCDRNTSGGAQACGASVNSYLNTTPGNEDQISGSLNVVTPEPSSLLLLGTGLLSVAGVARRRIFQA